jgi:Zn-finger nucleic acid-binding protein
MIPVCPKCDVGLIMLRFRGVEVDYCDRCRGVWLDAGELETLAGKLPEELWPTHPTGTPAKVPLFCPRCDQSLEEVKVEALLLDRCRVGHGWWFDRGELATLLTGPGGQELRELFDKKTSVA